MKIAVKLKRHEKLRMCEPQRLINALSMKFKGANKLLENLHVVGGAQEHSQAFFVDGRSVFQKASHRDRIV